MYNPRTNHQATEVLNTAHFRMVDPIALPRIPDVQPRNSHLLQFVPTDHAVTDAGLITLVIQHSMVQLAFSENIVKMP